MLKYRDPNKENVINTVNNAVDQYMNISAIQPFIEQDIYSILRKGFAHFENNKFIVHGTINFKKDNGNFIGPNNIPLKFADSFYGNLYANVPSSAINVDIRGWDISNIRQFKLAITDAGNVRIQTINVDGGDTSKMSDISNLFYACDKIRELDLSSWDLRKLKSFTDAFNGMSSLETVKFKPQVLTKLTNVSNLFYHSGNGRGKLDLSMLSGMTITRADNMFARSGFKEIDLRGGKFSSHCSFKNFGYAVKDIEIFNGVNLREAGYITEESGVFYLTDAFKEILKEQGAIV